MIIQSFESEEVETRLKDDVKVLLINSNGGDLNGNPGSSRK